MLGLGFRTYRVCNVGFGVHRFIEFRIRGLYRVAGTIIVLMCVDHGNILASHTHKNKTQPHTHTQTQTQTSTDPDPDADKNADADADRHGHTDTHRHTDTDTRANTHTHTHKQTTTLTCFRSRLVLYQDPSGYYHTHQGILSMGFENRVPLPSLVLIYYMRLHSPIR